uniref:Vacuolar protein sorting-associated protein 13 VPS13 adaptor binding domain-containing protein n=1 Tax=Meloidogyne incognita TaxID=6306 RepID=A0A914KU42_MELIC
MRTRNLRNESCGPEGCGHEQTKHSEIKHLPNQNPIILPLNEEDFYEKKKAKLRISDSEWSAEFPLDSAGSSGRITCHSEKKDFELTVDVKLCQSGLTKVVTISPFYLLQNDSKYCIEVREPNRNEWIVMPQTSVKCWGVLGVKVGVYLKKYWVLFCYLSLDTYDRDWGPCRILKNKRNESGE